MLSLPRFSASAPGGPQRERDGAVSGERDGQRESGQQRRGGLRTVPDGAVGLGDRLRRAGTGAGAAVGTATLAHGTTTKTVISTACTGSSQVILTPASNPRVFICVAHPENWTASYVREAESKEGSDRRAETYGHATTCATQQRPCSWPPVST